MALKDVVLSVENYLFNKVDFFVQDSRMGTETHYILPAPEGSFQIMVFYTRHACTFKI
jgi:hypothetical protein